MEKPHIPQSSDSDIKLFLDTLEKLEQQLESEGKPSLKTIEELFGSYSKANLEEYIRKYGSYNKPTIVDYSYYENKAGKRLTVEQYNDLQGKIQCLARICNEYERTILLTYFKYLELASVTILAINDLENRYKTFLTTYKDLSYLCFNFRFTSIIPSEKIYVSRELGDKFTKFSFSDYNEGFDIPFITHPRLLFNFEKGTWEHNHIWLQNYYNRQKGYYYNQTFSFNFSNLFESKTIINRIYLATILDNRSLLKSFIEEYKIYHPSESIMDLITSCSLVGLAAANGCIEVMKFFIEQKVSLEQRFTLNATTKALNSIEVNAQKICDPKSILTKYTDCTLEMTPLALALSAAPALTREKASNMIDLLLIAGANYKTKVIKTWTYEHGYYNNRQTSQKNTSITLFTFDQTGLLDELVKKLYEVKAKPRQERAKPKQEKSNDHNQPKKLVSTTNDPKISESQLIIEGQKKAIMLLEEEVNKLRLENTILKKEVETLKSSLPKKSIDDKQVITIQKMFRGYHARNNYSLTDLKEARKKEVLEKSSGIMGNLAKEGKFDQIAKLASAIKDEKYHDAMQIIRGIPEQEFELSNGLKIKY